MTMSKSEAGKLGALKSAAIVEQNKQDRIAKYLEDPKKCKCCSSPLSYDKRRNSFCGHSCGATYSNARKDWSNIITGPTPKTFEQHIARAQRAKLIRTAAVCLSCGAALFRGGHGGKFCNRVCQTEFIRKSKITEWKEGGKISARVIKRYIQEKYGKVCSVCGLTDWNNKPITLELEHKDGNSENNLEENLCLICPNCHSQTDTYKAKNKGNGRHSRRARYAEGKSY